ncbi:MAG: hypothetical protein FWB71_03475 [Defluviitaleaceae bacterium]|nr:hypothetical protein [Defluviitaleaceae bacterium]
MTVDVNAIPQPFREFLATEQKEISAASPDALAPARNNDMQDLLFLAAILLLTEN